MASEDGRLGRPCCVVEQNLKNIGQIKEERRILGLESGGGLQRRRFKGLICMAEERAEEK
jgi:hypothetical protein